MKKSLSLLLFCFWGVLPAVHADPTYEGVGTGILYFGLSPILLIYTLVAMVKITASDPRNQFRKSKFVLIGLVLYGIWLCTALKWWTWSALKEAITQHILKMLVMVGIHAFNLFGFCILLYCLFSNRNNKQAEC